MTQTVSQILEVVQQELQRQGIPESEAALGEAYARLVRQTLIERLRHLNRVLKDQKTAFLAARDTYELGKLYPDTLRVHADLKSTWDNALDDLDKLIGDNEVRITHHQFNLNRPD